MSSRPSFREQYGDWAVVTGASSGIGRAIAEELAQRRLDLLLVARSEASLESLARELRSRFGVRVEALALDLAQPGASQRLLTDLKGRSVGLAVLAAGFGSTGPFHESPLAQELEMLDVNCRVVLELSHAFSRSLAARGRGGILLFGSIVGFQGVPGTANYAATKAYIQSFGEALADEMRPRGVDVLVVAPGPTATGFSARAGMVMKQAESAERVARVSIDALGRQSVVVPGPLSKLLYTALMTAPRFLRVRILKHVIQGMTARS